MLYVYIYVDKLYIYVDKLYIMYVMYVVYMYIMYVYKNRQCLLLVISICQWPHGNSCTWANDVRSTLIYAVSS